jgi:hypothetical protein
MEDQTKIDPDVESYQQIIAQQQTKPEIFDDDEPVNKRRRLKRIVE